MGVGIVTAEGDADRVGFITIRLTGSEDVEERTPVGVDVAGETAPLLEDFFPRFEYWTVGPTIGRNSEVTLVNTVGISAVDEDAAVEGADSTTFLSR